MCVSCVERRRYVDTSYASRTLDTSSFFLRRNKRGADNFVGLFVFLLFICEHCGARVSIAKHRDAPFCVIFRCVNTIKSENCRSLFTLMIFSRLILEWVAQRYVVPMCCYVMMRLVPKWTQSCLRLCFRESFEYIIDASFLWSHKICGSLFFCFLFSRISFLDKNTTQCLLLSNEHRSLAVSLSTNFNPKFDSRTIREKVIEWHQWASSRIATAIESTQWEFLIDFLRVDFFYCGNKTAKLILIWIHIGRRGCMLHELFAPRKTISFESIQDVRQLFPGHILLSIDACVDFDLQLFDRI